MPTADQQVHLVAAAVGFTSYFLLWLAVVGGILLRGRRTRPGIYAAHTVTALCGLTLGVVHAAVQLAAPSGPVRLIDQFVPFVNPVDRLGIGVGTFGLELTIAAALSVAIQKRLGHRRWRALHALTYAAFTLVVAHILISGPDTASRYVWGAVVCTWLFTVLLWLTTTPLASRLSPRRSIPTGRSRAQEVTVDVDPMRCMRFGLCEQEAPDNFKLRGDGRLAFRAAVQAGQVDAVIRAAEVCPARAIALSRVPATGFPSDDSVQGRPISARPMSPRPIEVDLDDYDDYDDRRPYPRGVPNRDTDIYRRAR